MPTATARRPAVTTPEDTAQLLAQLRAAFFVPRREPNHCGCLHPPCVSVCTVEPWFSGE